MKCDKCKKEFDEEWKVGETYKSIDEHHNPPKFMMKKWKGKLLNLCRKHHRELHDKIIIILNDYSNLLKFNKSEYWVWIRMIKEEKRKARQEVIKFTRGWLNVNT